MRYPTSQVLRLLLLPLCLLGLQAGAARAAAVRTAQVAVLETRTAGDIRTEERARLGDALWAALDRLGLRRVPDTDREAVLQGEAGLRACLERDDCLERLGRLLEATHVIGASVARTAPTAYKAEVRLFDVDVGESGALIEWSCTACGIEDVAGKLDALVESAVQKDNQRPRATLLIRSSPPNADVQIDGRKVGFTELERRVFAGPHDIVVSLDRLGLAPEHLHIDVAPEQRLVLSLSPGPRVARVARAEQAPAEPRAVAQPQPEAPLPPLKHSRWKLGLGIPLLLLGAGGAAYGTYGLLRDGQCVTGVPLCERVVDSRLSGSLGVGIGAALLVTGVVLIAVDVTEHRRLSRQEQRREEAHQLRLGVAGPAGSAGLTLGLTF